jgi:hypothetical protein
MPPVGWKINNLKKKIAEANIELFTNPGSLPDQPRFLGEARKFSQQGHRELLEEYEGYLEDAEELYRKKCGGDPPSSNPARVPVPVPMPRPAPTPSRDNQRRRDAQGIPLGAKIAAGAGAGAVVFVIGKKVAGAALLVDPITAPAGLVLIFTP